MQTPRSPFDQVGGIVYFARMLDKIRLSVSGRLRHDFRKNIGIGFDGRCTRYLHVDYTGPNQALQPTPIYFKGPAWIGTVITFHRQRRCRRSRKA
jgi:hypothetical protein